VGEGVRGPAPAGVDAAQLRPLAGAGEGLDSLRLLAGHGLQAGDRVVVTVRRAVGGDAA